MKSKKSEWQPCRASLIALVFAENLLFCSIYFDHLRPVPELIIKSVEDLTLVSDKELFIGIVKGTKNVGFAK